MKLLSLWEPWATLMAIGAKRIETRSWSTLYRGPLAIQSAKHFTSDEDDLCWASPFREALQSAGIPAIEHRNGYRFQFPHGHIVAIVNLKTCISTDELVASSPHLPHQRHSGQSSMHPDYALTKKEYAFGNYDPRRYGWMTADLFRLSEPIPFKARQGLCAVPQLVIDSIRRQGWSVPCE